MVCGRRIVSVKRAGTGAAFRTTAEAELGPPAGPSPTHEHVEADEEELAGCSDFGLGQNNIETSSRPRQRWIRDDDNAPPSPVRWMGGRVGGGLG